MKRLHIGTITGGYRNINLRAIQSGDWHRAALRQGPYEWMLNHISEPKLEVVMRGWAIKRFKNDHARRVFNIFTKLNKDDALLAELSGWKLYE